MVAYFVTVAFLSFVTPALMILDRTAFYICTEVCFCLITLCDLVQQIYAL